MEIPKSLYISNVEDQFTADCIVNLFYNEGIANICRITIIPKEKCDITKMNPNKKYNKVYIEISSWCSTLKAYNILACFGSNTYIPTLFYDEDNCWEIKINKTPYICYNSINKTYTKLFKPLHMHIVNDNGFNNYISSILQQPTNTNILMYCANYNTMIPYYTYPFQLSNNIIVPV
jgi:hypothetical protein